MSKKKAWILRMKEEVSISEYDGSPYYLCDDEATEFLTANINKAEIVYDKDAEIQYRKKYDVFMIKKYGVDSVRNYGWEYISKNFDFVEVGVEMVSESNE